MVAYRTRPLDLVLPSMRRNSGEDYTKNSEGLVWPGYLGQGMDLNRILTICYVRPTNIRTRSLESYSSLTHLTRLARDRPEGLGPSRSCVFRAT